MSAEANHLAIRSVADLGNENFPGSDVPGSYFYNPVKSNVFAVNYYSEGTQNPDPGSVRRLPGWTQVTCPAAPPVRP